MMTNQIHSCRLSVYLYDGYHPLHVCTHCMLLFFSTDPTLTPPHTIPVFEAITRDWHQIGNDTKQIIVPDARAAVIRQQFSDPLDQRRRGGEYYALYCPWASWKGLSLNLYRAGETKAVQLTRPHLQTVRGNYTALQVWWHTLHVIGYHV